MLESKREPLRLMVFDLDGTLVTGPDVSAIIVKSLGYGSRLAELEPLPKGDEAGRRRQVDQIASWLHGRSIEELTSPLAQCVLAPGTEAAFALLHAHGVETAIASFQWEFAVGWFAKKLGIQRTLGTVLHGNGTVTLISAEEKGRWVQGLIKERSLDVGQAGAVGDSWRDVPMLSAVGHAFYVGPQLPPELAHVHHHPDGDMLRIAQTVLRL